MSSNAGQNNELLVQIRTLLTQSEQEGAAFFSLGVPYVGLNNDTQAIIRLGPAAVQPLLSSLPGASAHTAACIAYCLGEIGDPRAATALSELLEQYENKPDKTPYDRTVIGNAQIALNQLQSPH